MEANPQRNPAPVMLNVEVAPLTGSAVKPDRDSVMFDLLGDRYAEAIIVATIPAPRSALELVQTLGIPTAACYRRLAELCEVGLLAVDGFAPGMKGKTTRMYRSRVKRITYDVSESGTVLVIQFVDGERRRIASAKGRTVGVTVSE